jgi:tetratricopeptide (TPR) repeat protein
MTQQQTVGEDRFVTTLMQTMAWAQKNTRALVLGLGALVIVVFAVLYYLDYRRRVEEAASGELREIRYAAETSTGDEVVRHLRSFITQYDGTAYAQEARVLLAQVLLTSNRASEAIEPARQAMGDLNLVLPQRAAFLLAAAYEEVADTAQAIQVYETIGRGVESRGQKSRALQAAARLRAARGDAAGAAALCQELVQLTPEAVPARSYFEMCVAEAEAQKVRLASSGEG